MVASDPATKSVLCDGIEEDVKLKVHIDWPSDEHAGIRRITSSRSQSYPAVSMTTWWLCCWHYHKSKYADRKFDVQESLLNMIFPLFRSPNEGYSNFHQILLQ
jgi:hypothetical protein